MTANTNTTNATNTQESNAIQNDVHDIKNAIESLRDPLVYNQALTDCLSLLNLSLDTLLAHFQQWLWKEDGEAYTDGGEEAYAIQLSRIEEHLVIQGLIYDL